MFPQNLVCDKCWSSFFNTEAFEKCCTADRSQSGYENGRIETVATVIEIKDAVCNWCAYIRGFLSESWMPEDKVTTALSPTLITSCTPAGGNIFYLSIDCESPRGKWRGGSSLFLHACTAADDPASKYVTARPFRTDTDSDVARTQMRTWLGECKKHRFCSNLREDSLLPTRVIEVSPLGQQCPRILESRNLRGTYATLSYCWGERTFPTLTTANYAQFTTGLNMEILPPTIRDAVAIARILSIPYLWVDALCIIQDFEEDKAREIAKMKEFYSSSVLTIVAAASESVYAGFIYPRVHQETLYTIPVRIGPRAFGTMSINELNGACYDERFEPIAKRAWTMQEQLLSNRTLSFTTHTMMWRCREGVQNFGNSLYFPHDLDSGYNDNDEKYSLNLHSLFLKEEEASSSKEESLSCWLRLVTVNSLRVTRLERDKLNALAGIASHPSFSRVLGPRYFAGLWQYSLSRQLTWYTSRWHRTLAEDDSFTFHRPIRYRAPSWSWASLDGGIIHFDFSFDDETPPEVVCDVTDCSTKPTFPRLNPFGEILSAQLSLKSPTRRAWFKPSTSNIFLLSGSITSMSTIWTPDDCMMTFEEALQEHTDDFVSAHPDLDLIEDPEATHGTNFRNICGTCDETESCEPILVLCVAITMKRELDDGVRGLLLVKSEDKGSNNMLRRIGVFERGRNTDFENEPKREVCII